jgi:predicted HD phosphohydrolase
MTPNQVLGLIAELLQSAPSAPHSDGPVGVGPLEHALQCAQLAEWAHADPELVAAALLHDIGHLFDARSRALGLRTDGRGIDDGHEQRAIHWLRQAFADEVTEPVRLHVQAKRYLVAFDPRYLEALSPSSLHALSLQGGPMTPLEMRRFELGPHAGAAIKLRIWDDLAMHPGKSTPPLSHYLRLLEELILPASPQRPPNPPMFRAAA